jgi:ComF family protein
LNRMKYRDKPELAFAMGRFIGNKIQHLDWVHELDLLISIPVHPKKEFLRGYNQSERLAAGISEVVTVPVDNSFLLKTLHTVSQTKKGRFGRWDNLKDAFEVSDNRTENIHIALVDDVLTTGATLERIIGLIKEKYPDIRVSIITLAIAV